MSAATATPDMASPSGILSPTNLFIYLLVPALALWYAYWKISRRHMLELAEKIPGPTGWPLIGSALEFVGSSHQIFTRVYQKSYEFGSTIKLWAGPKLLIFLTDPRDVEIILSSHVHIDKSPDYRFFKPWLGDGLLISTGQKWRAHRKLIAPTFHLNVLKSFIDLFNKNSRETVKKMEKELGKEFDVHDYMSEATVEILLETAMGVSKRTQTQSGYEYAMAVMKMCDILHMRHTKIWLRPDILFNLTNYGKYQEKLINTIHSLTRRVIQRKKADFEKGIRGSTAEVPEELKTKNYEKNVSSKTVVEGLSYGQSAGLKDDLDVEDDVGEKKRMAFLDLMIEASQNGVVINDEEIKEQVDTIMFEGHDTTAAGSSFFLCQMAAHPEIQEKVVQEIYEIFGDSDRPATFADTLEMKYLERCLMETLRLFPPVPIIARQINQDVKLASADLTLPAGSTVVIGTFKVHRLEDIYPNPDKYDPDNFLPERTANRHYYSFIPFSAGPRSCVGTLYQAEIYAILACAQENLSRKYRNQSILICTDSQAALGALSSYQFKSQMAWECLQVLQVVPGYSDITGNEHADVLARQGANTPFNGPEPVLGIPRSWDRQRIDEWLIEGHNGIWSGTSIAGHAKRLLTEPSRQVARELLSLSRRKIMMAVGLIKGHCRLNKHLTLLSEEDPDCRICGETEESAYHIICECEGLQDLRLHRFGVVQVLPEKCRPIPIRDLIAFADATGLFEGRKYAMLKLKILLSTILRNFHIKSSKKELDYKLQGDIILKREDGFSISLEPRKRTVKA